MDKTVSDIAKELNINKLRIYRYIKKQNINPTRIYKNVQYFNDSSSNTILNHFKHMNGDRVSTDTHMDTTDTPKDNNENTLLKIKDSIIYRQDREIKHLYNHIESLQRTINQQNKQFDQQQQLELESIRTFKKNVMINDEHRPDNYDTSSDTKRDNSNTKKHTKNRRILDWFKRSK